MENQLKLTGNFNSHEVLIKEITSISESVSLFFKSLPNRAKPENKYTAFDKGNPNEKDHITNITTITEWDNNWSDFSNWKDK